MAQNNSERGEIKTIWGGVAQIDEVRYTSSGKAVANFNVAVSTKHGEEYETTWYKCTVWEEQTDLLDQLRSMKEQLSAMPEGKRGLKVMAFGPVKTETYAKRDGSQGSNLVMSVWQMAVMLRSDVELRFDVGERSDADAPAEDFTRGSSVKPLSDYDEVPF